MTVGRNEGVTLVPTDLTVIAPDGGPVAVDGRDTNMTISRNGDVFTSVLEFRAPVRGQYLLRFENPYPRRVMVGRSLASVFIGLIPWAVGALAGLGLVAGGIVLVILGRTRAARPTIAAGGVPAQWATDPYGAHRLRYWDGANPSGVDLGADATLHTDVDHDWWAVRSHAGSILETLHIPEPWKRWGIARGTVAGERPASSDGRDDYVAGYSLLNMTKLQDAGDYDIRQLMMVVPGGYEPGDESEARAMAEEPLRTTVTRIR